MTAQGCGRGDDASRSGVEQRGHVALISGGCARHGQVHARQDPLPWTAATGTALQLIRSQPGC